MLEYGRNRNHYEITFVGLVQNKMTNPKLQTPTLKVYCTESKKSRLCDVVNKFVFEFIESSIAID